VNVTSWFNLMHQMGLSDNRSIYDALLASYTEKNRHYHTDAHISACLYHMNQTRYLAAITRLRGLFALAYKPHRSVFPSARMVFFLATNLRFSN
jgi:predicted metal-dependent HD superfamily phosphohydrolase